MLALLVTRKSSTALLENHAKARITIIIIIMLPNQAIASKARITSQLQQKQGVATYKSMAQGDTAVLHAAGTIIQ
jgi:hypothetical protein